MIVAERKPIKEILSMVEGKKRLLLLGCQGCVTVCAAGGEKEVQILASAIRIYRKKKNEPVETGERTIVRQCDPEFLDELAGSMDQYDAVISLACGAGINYLADRYPHTVVIPGVNTKFIGVAEAHGIWVERCMGCGDCILGLTGGLCPIARCSKGLFNGPCGGSVDGKCEVNPAVPCVWQLIYDRLKTLNQLERLDEIIPVKDWSASPHGGPRKVVREDLTI